MRHKETDYIYGVLQILYANGERCGMKEIKNNIAEYAGFEMTYEDLAPYGSRSKTEPSYRQIVGNLVSHRHPDLFKYVETYRDPKHAGKFLYRLNVTGIAYVEAIESEDEHVKSLDKETEAYIDENEPVSTAADINVTIPASCVAVNETANDELTLPLEIYRSLAPANLFEESADMLENKHCILDAGNHCQEAKLYYLIPLSVAEEFAPVNINIKANTVRLCEKHALEFNHATPAMKKELLGQMYLHKKRELNMAGIFLSSVDELFSYYQEGE